MGWRKLVGENRGEYDQEMFYNVYNYFKNAADLSLQ